MIHNIFVKGKNQNSFAFVMVNEKKEQLSLFTQGIEQAQKPAKVAPITVAPVQPRPAPITIQASGFSPDEIAIIDARRKGANIADIMQRPGISAKAITEILLLLERSGKVTTKAGRIFIKT